MDLYAFGSNGSGQLGVGHAKDIDSPEQCIFDAVHMHESIRIRKIAASGTSTLVLWDNGQTHVSGAGFGNHHSQFPEGSTSFRTFPFPCEQHPRFCSATWDAVIIATEVDVFVCGRGGKGELGLGPNTCQADTIQKLESFPPDGQTIVDLASSVSHTVVVLSNGDVYGWGNGRKGQLGAPSDIVWYPRRLEGLGFKARRATCGREFTFVVAEPDSPKFEVLGSDKWGARSNAPTNLDTWLDIGASWGSIFVHTHAGMIICWGRNDKSQLGPNELGGVLRMGIGSEHGIAQTKDAQLTCWGWGEHGNCGVAMDEAESDFRCNDVDSTLPGGHVVAGVGAGCATTFLWTKPNSVQI